MTRIPALGRRGEGWVVLQVLLFGLIAVLGAVNLPSADPGAAGLVVIGLGVVLGFLGGLVILQGLRGLGRNLTPLPYPRDDATLVRDGIYGRIRHPIYAGTMALALAWTCITLSLPALAATLILLLVLDLKARREEVWLLDRYPEYDAYRAATKRFVPGLY